jgi:trafficking protein particle complex subunit 12
VGRGPRGETREKVVDALCDMADGEYEAALAKWEEPKDESEDEMVGVNMALCWLYVGRMHEVSLTGQTAYRKLLTIFMQGKAFIESLVASSRSSRTLLFDLATMYELCTERATTLKLELSGTVAIMDGSASGPGGGLMPI